MIVTRTHGGDPDIGPPLCISAPGNESELSFSPIGKAHRITRITAGYPSLTLRFPRKTRHLPDQNKYSSLPRSPLDGVKINFKSSGILAGQLEPSSSGDDESDRPALTRMVPTWVPDASSTTPIVRP